MSEQVKLRCTLMRGGTSKAVFLDPQHLPSDPAGRKRLLLALFGSPDKRQIDGLGGADPLTSKCALVAPSKRSDADIDYTFLQIGVDKPTISEEIVCGNISSAAAVYAIEEGHVPAVEPETRVAIHNTNTGRIFVATVKVSHGAPEVEGDFQIDGVPGTGAEVKLDYSATSGGATGRLLPSGRVRDSVHIAALGRTLEVSVIDVGTVCVFFDARDIGLDGTELPAAFDARHYQLSEDIRLAASELCGLSESVLTPFQICIGQASEYSTFAGDRRIEVGEIDFTARMVVGRDTLVHKAFPGGGSVCTSVAARIEGTVVQRISGRTERCGAVRIGHPSGVLSIHSDVAMRDGEWVVNEVHFSRTARRLMEGYAFVRTALAG